MVQSHFQVTQSLISTQVRTQARMASGSTFLQALRPIIAITLFFDKACMKQGSKRCAPDST